MNTPEQRASYIAGLRHLATVLEEHPGIRLPYDGTLGAVTIHFHYPSEPGDDLVAEMAAAIRILGGTWTEWAPGEDDSYRLKGHPGGLHMILSVKSADVATSDALRGLRIVPDRAVPVAGDVPPGPVLLAGAGERVATPAEKAADAARLERARQAAAAADPSPLPPLPAPGERPRQGTTKGGGVVWANADHHDDPPATAEQDKAAFESAGHCGSPA